MKGGEMANKKKYQKPMIKTVELVPEEAVLLGCKTGANGAGNGVGKKCAALGGCTASATGT
jgi:hypothetical protein